MKESVKGIAPTVVLHYPILPGGLLRDGAGNVVREIPDRPAPELLTEEEAIRYLRLDEPNVKHPERTLAYYRKEWALRATQIGRSLKYRRIELDRLIDRLTGTTGE